VGAAKFEPVEVAARGLDTLVRTTLWWAKAPDPAERHRAKLPWRVGTAYAGLLHDLGKIWELSYDQAFEYTEEGRLVGHLLLESNWLAARMEEIDGFPAPLKHHVLHLLASHHGLHEHGAPVRPATREALALHYADDLDSKMGAMDVAIEEAEATGADTAYSRSLGRRILRRSWKEVDD